MSRSTASEVLWQRTLVASIGTVVSVLVCVLGATQSAVAQSHPFTAFPGSYEVLRTTMPAPDAKILYQRVADGLGLHAIWRHGSGDTFYEAHSLWGYDPNSSLVTVLEVNSAGIVAVHEGRFDSAGVLKLERFAADGVKVLERRAFWWSDEQTLEMTADFFTGSNPVHHEVTIVKR